ncbi:MAG: 3-mercaptopyruvate sulfurtransferase [Kordiimonadaceae bacterium]|nr:3-mercaptopyruvate sulfurtransferase [Kordiimonadaceae bacterium]
MANSPLKNTEWLAKNLSRDGLVILDASWHLPASGRSAAEEYKADHIPGAHFFDIDVITDQRSELPHMLPGPRDFAFAVRKFGVTNGSKIIIYENEGSFAAARAWWMFRSMGHKNVYVLNGGMRKWRADKQLTDGKPQYAEETVYYADATKSLSLSRDDILANIDTGERQIIDARSTGRFNGTEAEPREGLRGGHIPGSINLPVAELYSGDGTLLERNLLTEKFTDAGVDFSKPLGTTCGSGVTASCLALALAQLGHWNTLVYDGSWTEWGADEALPLET